MKRWNRRAEQRHRSKRPHKRYHPPDERMVMQPAIEHYPSGALKSMVVDSSRLHWQDGQWYKMLDGARVDADG